VFSFNQKAMNKQKDIKIGIITRHFIPNYGSFLQSFALVSYLNSLGYSAEIINYVPENEQEASVLNQAKKLKGIKKAFYNLLITPLHRKSYLDMERIRKEYLKESPLYSEKNISLAKYDIYMAGSDQLWGTIGNKFFDPNYFLGFTSSKNKISFSSSFGFRNFSSLYHVPYSTLLSQFKSISVREESAKAFLSSLSINSEVVLDPTFLLTKKEYENLARIPKEGKKNYILVYQLHHDSMAQKVADNISKLSGCCIVSVTPNLARAFFSFRTKYCYDPFQFLTFLANAKYVVTDSFHGTVFSIIFGKQFYSINPGKTAARIEDLLSRLCLESRFISTKSIDCLLPDIDYSFVNSKLDEEIRKTKKILQDELRGCN